MITDSIYNNTKITDARDFHKKIVKAIYPEATIADGVITYSRIPYQIDPTTRYLVHKNNAVRDSLYSVDNIQEAIDHELSDRAHVKLDIQQWIASDIKHAIFSENTGSGKTGTVVDLFDTAPADQQLIATFHTKQARDAFTKRCNIDVRVVHSTAEILSNVLGSDRALGIQEALEELYEAHTNESTLKFEKATDKLIQKNLMSVDQQVEILKRYNHAKYLLTTNHKLAMTTLKFEFLATYVTEESRLRDIPVFIDEIHLDQVSNATGKVSVYNNDNWNVYRVNPKVDQSRLQEFKICFISAERFIEKELIANDMPYKRIGWHNKLFAPNLEIVRVRSTQTGDIRQGIYNKCRNAYPDADIIVNAIDGDENINFVSARGSNAHRDSQTVIVIASYPTAEEVARCMLSCNLAEKDALDLVMTDTVNQMIGRNQGYRDASGYNRCLLVIPSKADIDLDFVTQRACTKTGWPQTTLEHRQTFYFKNLIDDLCSYEDETEAVLEFLKIERENGADDVRVGSIVDELGVHQRRVSSILEKLGIPTKRKQRKPLPQLLYADISGL